MLDLAQGAPYNTLEVLNRLVASPFLPSELGFVAVLCQSLPGAVLPSTFGVCRALLIPAFVD